MRGTWFRWILAASLSGGVCGVGAETGARPPARQAPAMGTPELLSLGEAKRLALERNWDLLAAKSDVDIAMAQKIMAREFPNPTFSWTTSKVPVNGQPASTSYGNSIWDRSYDTVSSVNQLLEIGGKRRSRQQSADHGFAASKARMENARRLLDLGVTQAYIAVVQAELTVQTLRNSAAALRREADIASIRFQAGDISTADKSQIEILAMRFEVDARAAEASALQQRLGLENLIGSSQPTGAWKATDNLESLLGEPPARNEQNPIPRRSDLVAAEALRKKAEADLRLQKALRIPDPTVLMMYEHNPPDANHTIGLGLSFPLPLWNHNRGAIKAAEAARDQAAVQEDKVRAQIAADIATARSAYQDAAARYDHYQREIKARSASILEAISFAYQKGGASVLDLLSAQRNDNEVRLAAVQSAAAAAAALAALQAAQSEAGGLENKMDPR